MFEISFTILKELKQRLRNFPLQLNFSLAYSIFGGWYEKYDYLSHLKLADRHGHPVKIKIYPVWKFKIYYEKKIFQICFLIYKILILNKFNLFKN